MSREWTMQWRHCPDMFNSHRTWGFEEHSHQNRQWLFHKHVQKISLLWLNKNVFNSSKVKLWREMASKMMACIKSWYPCTLERSIELKRVSMFLPEKGSVEWNSSRSLLHFIIHIGLSVQEFKKDGRFFVQLIKNPFVQRIEIVIQLVKGKLCISQGFNEQSANKLFVVGKVSRI